VERGYGFSTGMSVKLNKTSTDPEVDWPDEGKKKQEKGLHGRA